jgi:hypothetical protein
MPRQLPAPKITPIADSIPLRPTDVAPLRLGPLPVKPARPVRRPL